MVTREGVPKVQEEERERQRKFLQDFKVEDIFLPQHLDHVDLIITGKAPNDFDQVLIDSLMGKTWGSYKVVGFEKFLTKGPWRKDTLVGIGLRKCS